MRDSGPELFVPSNVSMVIPKIPGRQISLDEAMQVCEDAGFVLIAKHRLKTLSFHVAITDLENRYGEADRILKNYEDKRTASFYEQLEKSEAIKYNQRVETKPCVTFHSWKLKVIV